LLPNLGACVNFVNGFGILKRKRVAGLQIVVGVCLLEAIEYGFGGWWLCGKCFFERKSGSFFCVL